MKYFSVLLVFPLLFIAFTTGLDSDFGWSIVKENEHILVFKRPTSNGYNAIRIEATISTPLESFIDFVNQVDRYPEWVFKCREVKDLGHPGDGNIKYWMVSDFPFPFKDRELTIESSHHIDHTGIFHSNSKAIPNQVDSSNIAITRFDARWTVTPVRPGQIKIEYEVQTEPGGTIPAWLYNLAVDLGPFKTMQNLKEILEEEY
jgi:hypothetical protein